MRRGQQRRAHEHDDYHDHHDHHDYPFVECGTGASATVGTRRSD
jgi:hypothetical protein